MRRFVVALAVVFLAAGCGGDSPTVRDAETTTEGERAETQTSDVDAYTTSSFFEGKMTVRFENGWTVTEDSRGHLAVAEIDDREYRVMFSLDAYPFEAGKRVKGVSATADGLSAWLRANPNLRVTPRGEGSIGGDLPATVADVSLSDKAVTDDPGCPANTCVNFFAFPPSGEGYGLAGDDVMRLYLADVEYGGKRHLLVISIEGRDRADLDAFLPAAERLIATAELPVRPA